jgi:hypothetical protein
VAIAGKYPCAASQFYSQLAKNNKRIDILDLSLFSDRMKARVIQAVGIEQLSINPSIASRLGDESLKLAVSHGDYYTVTVSHSLRAVAASFQGDHKLALSILSKGFPYARVLYRTYPAQYFNYLNPIALELAANGFVSAAQRTIQIATSSPFTFDFPEWQESAYDIARLDHEPKTRSVYFPTIPLRLIKTKEQGMMQQAQSSPEEIGIDLMRAIENDVWHIVAHLENKEKVRVLNYIRNLEPRMHAVNVPA